ncbi:hypothetical protein ACBY01_01465 [Sphingomonas sp. ac-8]|uniref:hypothetical protein n=1 Tax=Sphingomonas sp. ac-8 TaxID=3242977 RepID=UPI003A806A39
MKISPEAAAVLASLGRYGSVLISGPPACGKTRLMQEVAEAFVAVGSTQENGKPQLNQKGFVAIPKVPPAPAAVGPIVPSSDRRQRHVQRIAFSPNTKARDFTTGYAPALGGSFQVVKGALITANEAALSGGASLLIVDEMNRGPAVQLFGDALVAMEREARLLPDDSVGTRSWPMRILDSNTGQLTDFYLSHHLYILGAINQADVSVDPMDVAFLRRFAPIQLNPRSDLVRDILGAVGSKADLPKDAPSPAEMMEALVRAWEHVNSQIAIGLSPELRIGHGILLSTPSAPASVEEGRRVALESWLKVVAHVKEVFFGDVVGLGLALRAELGSSGYGLSDVTYGLNQKQLLREPSLAPNSIYTVLRQVGG